MSEFGSQSMVAPLKRVLLRRPVAALADMDLSPWHYQDRLDVSVLYEQHSGFVDLLRAQGIQPEFLPECGDQLADSMFAYDPSLMTREGAILLSMGKALRRDEVALHEQYFLDQALPILGRIQAPGRVEGGDTLWISDNELWVGRGFRTNQAGIDQLIDLLSPLGVRVTVFDLPLYQGEAACLHLMSLISLLSERSALIHQPLLPVAAYQALCERGFDLVQAPEDEFIASNTLSTNILTLRPGVGVMVAGWPKTAAAIRASGYELHTFAGDMLCECCEGGPTCLTRPLWRA